MRVQSFFLVALLLVVLGVVVSVRPRAFWTPLPPLSTDTLRIFLSAADCAQTLAVGSVSAHLSLPFACLACMFLFSIGNNLFNFRTAFYVLAGADEPLETTSQQRIDATLAR